MQRERESVCMCVFCAGGLCMSVASRHWSECAAHCKPRDKRTEVPHAFANGCSALFKNPFTVSWRLTQSPRNQLCTAGMQCPLLNKAQGSLEYRNPWYVHILYDLHPCMNFTVRLIHYQVIGVQMRGFPSPHSVSIRGSEWQVCQHVY